MCPYIGETCHIPRLGQLHTLKLERCMPRQGRGHKGGVLLFRKNDVLMYGRHQRRSYGRVSMPFCRTVLPSMLSVGESMIALA